MMLRLPAAALCVLLAMPCALRAEPAPAPHSAIPYKQEKQGGAGMAYQSVAALVLASLAAYGIVLGLKKIKAMPGGALRKPRRMTLVETTRLSRRSLLHVVDYHGEELLLAESEHGLTLLKCRPGAGAADA